MAATTLSTAHLTALRESVLIDPGLSLFYPKAFEYGIKSMRQANQVLKKHILCAPDPTLCFATIGEMINFFDPIDDEKYEWSSFAEEYAEEYETLDQVNRALNNAEVAFQAADNEAKTYDLKRHRSAARQVAPRRQVHRASRRPARKAGTKASGGGDDGDGGDGEPPRHRSSHASRSKLESPSSKNVVNEIGVSNSRKAARSYGRTAGATFGSAGPTAGTPTSVVPSTTRLASGSSSSRSRTMDMSIQAADDGIGVPPPAFPQLFSYQSFAAILDCSPQTLKNKVCLGQFPKPRPTVVGPRFTQDQVQSVLNATWQPEPKEKKTQIPAPRPRGRPRIAAQQAQGVRS